MPPGGRLYLTTCNQYPHPPLRYSIQEGSCKAIWSQKSCMDTWWQWRLYRGDHPSGNIYLQSDLVYLRVNIQNDDGEKATVLLGHENKHFKSDQVENFCFFFNLPSFFTRLCPSILQSLRNARIWPIWPSSVRRLYFGTSSRVIRQLLYFS